MIVAKRHLNYINSEFQVHYNRERPHEGIGHVPPDWSDPAPSIAARGEIDVVCSSRLGGQLKTYTLRAA